MPGSESSAEPLFGKTLEQIEEITKKLHLPSYTARQICRWLYRSHVRDLSTMTDVSKEARLALSALYSLGVSLPLSCSSSKDGTKKYLFSPGIESAFIPETDRATLCLSTQIGCKWGCRFCLTGKQGFRGNLTAGQILNQYESLPEREKVTNFVYMGMGEPLDNWPSVLDSLKILTSDWGYGISPTRITISTIGVLPELNRLVLDTNCHIALSLHSPFEEERALLMPAQRRHPLREILQTLKRFELPKQRRVSFEYIVFEGINHTPKHVKEIARLMQGLRCRINLIPFHETQQDIPLPDGRTLKPAALETILEFQTRLNQKGIRTTLRKSRGQDIEAACGQLSTAHILSTHIQGNCLEIGT